MENLILWDEKKSKELHEKVWEESSCNLFSKIGRKNAVIGNVFWLKAKCVNIRRCGISANERTIHPSHNL